MWIGINTGYCNVGNFGSEERMDYTIIGTEVNLAARIQAAADPGGTSIPIRPGRWRATSRAPRNAAASPPRASGARSAFSRSPAFSTIAIPRPSPARNRGALSSLTRRSDRAGAHLKSPR
jgi:hypothetical protein